MGGFEPVAKPWGMDGHPDKFEFQLLPEDWTSPACDGGGNAPRARARDRGRESPAQRPR